MRGSLLATTRVCWRSVVVALLILAGVQSCGTQKSEAVQARELLLLLAGLEPDAPVAARSLQLVELEKLPLRFPELAKVRDQCLAAHRGLLRAEEEQDGAQKALEEAVARHGDAGIPPNETQAIAALIGRSNSALREAQQALPDCDQRTRALTKRYR